MNKRHFFKLGLISLIILTIQSCGINSNFMLKSPKGEHALVDTIPFKHIEDYTISISDKLAFTLLTNDGSGIGSNLPVTEFVVRNSGFVDLPILGDVKVEGLTIKQCEDTLESFYANYFVDPFVQVKVTNQRAILFRSGSDPRVVPLTNPNTTLMEFLAQGGGIPDEGKSKSIMLIRKIGDQRKIYNIDLSTIEGLKYVDMIIQANDYVYIEPKPQFILKLRQDVLMPVTTLITSFLLVFTIFNKF
jgi:polysaccharide export outer membrane protein